MGPAHLLARSVKLDRPKKLLDVAGGSGAFTIALCRRHPELASTIVDFPAVIDVAMEYVENAGLGHRVDYRRGNALNVEWPADNDMVLMSCLLSAVGNGEIDRIFDMAYTATRPGSCLVVHDFMVDDDRSGPATAALWMLVISGFDSPVCLTGADLQTRAAAAGFVDMTCDDLAPTITRVLTAKRPA